MLDLKEIENLEHKLNALIDEVDSCYRRADSQMGKEYHMKIGDLNLRDGFYLELKPIIVAICKHRTLRDYYFSDEKRSQNSRRILLVFMSELIYWEYENSFWQKFYEVLEISNDWNWFTTQMRKGFVENGIDLITWTGRNEYVRTIIFESGFSKQLIQEVKDFVFWFFEHFSDLDPRILDANSFQKIVKTYKNGSLDNDEIFDLLREIVGMVCLLLRETRRRYFTSSDFRNPEVIAELENALGFHPIKGIFGFRKAEDIEELLEVLSQRITPNKFHALLKRKIHSNGKSIRVLTPDNQLMQVSKPQSVPIMFGRYEVIGSEVHIVPREAITISKVNELLAFPRGRFHTDSSDYIWLHDLEPFEVFQGSNQPDDSIPYYINSSKGYLWYGRQKIALTIRAERDGNVIAEANPREDVSLNPRLRLDKSGSGLVVVIPSFTCLEPKYAGKTVRFELNGRPIENTTYVINRDGALQFQTTRIAKVLPDDTKLTISLVTLDGNEKIVSKNILQVFPISMLFNTSNRELIQPGDQEYCSTHLTLFSNSNIDFSNLTNIKIDGETKFGKYIVYHLSWIRDSFSTQTLELIINGGSWRFSKPIDIYLVSRCVPCKSFFSPEENNAVFSHKEISLEIHYPNQSRNIWSQLNETSIVIEKDEEFITDIRFSELKVIGTTNENPIQVDVDKLFQYLVETFYIDKVIGSYKFSLELRPKRIGESQLLSEVDFMVLPSFDVYDHDALMIEGEESIVTVKCTDPLIADSEDKPTDVIQIDFRPTADFDKIYNQIIPLPIEKSIRLKYPPTKVTLKFIPTKMLAFRLVSKYKAVRSSLLTYQDAHDSYVLLLGLPGEQIRIYSVEYDKRLQMGKDGTKIWNVKDGLSSIRGVSTSFFISSIGEKDILLGKIDIVWHVNLIFDRERTTKYIDPIEFGMLTLFAQVDGPPDSEIRINLSDNRLKPHGVFTYHLSMFTGEAVELPLDKSKLDNAKSIFCSAFYEKNKLDAITIPVGSSISREKAIEEFSIEIERAKQELELLPPVVLLEKLHLYDGVEPKDLELKALQEMYSERSLDAIHEEYKNKKISGDFIAMYFDRFDNRKFVDVTQIPTWKLKLYCFLPVPDLVTICARELIIRNDCVGVDHVIEDLLEFKVISMEKGLEILSANRECSAENIRDRINWDDLEHENDDFIRLMIKLAEEFHPAVKRKAKEALEWVRAIQIKNENNIIDVKILSAYSNGLIASSGLINGRIPISEIDLKRHDLVGDHKYIVQGLDKLIHSSIKVLVIDVNRKDDCLIFSEVKAQSKAIEDFWKTAKIGNIRDGIVTGIKEYGVFVDLDGITGLIHSSEISWEKTIPVEWPIIGQKIQVFIYGLEKQEKKVSLSLKRLHPKPISEYIIGSSVIARVIRIRDSGVDVIVSDRTKGFIHISELANETIINPNKMIKVGEEIKTRVLVYDVSQDKLILSLKQADEENFYLGHFRVKGGTKKE